MAASTCLRKLLLRLYDVEAVKFGDFKLKSGIQSPIYFDLRVIVSYPDLLESVSDLVGQMMKEKNIQCSSVCGVPYTALPIATCVTVKHKIPMLIRRKEAKDYGTKKLIEGHFCSGDVCLIIEDVVTSGTSVLETAQVLREVGLDVHDAIVFLNREQGGTKHLVDNGVQLHSVCSISELLKILHEERKITDDILAKVRMFVSNNSTVPTCQSSVKKDVRLAFAKRASLCSNPSTKRLCEVIETKQSNLAVAVDVSACADLLKLAENLGPHICILKTHVDALEDFSSDFPVRLKEIATKHNFLLMEDRKFSDIGNTVQLQYSSGVFRIADWADIVTAHSLPGPDMLKALSMVGIEKGRSCILVAEMSSRDNLITAEYTSASVKMASTYPDFVMGFVSQSLLTSNPCFIQMTPGVSFGGSGDSLGQQYISPTEAVVNRGADVIIVGRGIVGAQDPITTAIKYKEAAMQAYAGLVKD